jgi:ABC-type hemin transport system ATPase subunit
LSAALATNGKAVVLASHDLNLVSSYATRIALFQSEKLAVSGPSLEALSVDVLQNVFHLAVGSSVDPSGPRYFGFVRRNDSRRRRSA